MTTVTKNMLENKIDYLNEITGSPAIPYIRENNKSIAQIGNFNLYQAYGSFGLHRISNESGGVSTPINGLYTKRELYWQITSLISGYEMARNAGGARF